MEIVVCGLILAYMSICAFVCSRIATHKNRGADEWFVCGELLGLFAVVAIWLLRPLPDRPPKRV